MQDYTQVQFKGRFREYQQRVLNQSELYLNDKRIHIVAAPGSGKTILGLELIRRLNQPALILSPTTTIRDQWIERFQESFLPETEDLQAYITSNLHQIKLINSITYQALYSAISKVKASSADEEIDYSMIDLFKVIDINHIQTVCLDEAHHLQNEWQKSLEFLLKKLGQSVTIISLTATPPYDAKTVEWERYASLCGPIDDEIFVPELVKEKTLCPHQDYILFNYPTKNEIESFKHYHELVYHALTEISQLAFVKECFDRIKKQEKKNEEFIYEQSKGVIALLIFLNFYGFKTDKYLFQKLTFSKHIPSLNLKFAEKAIEFLLDWEEIHEEDKIQIIEILKQHTAYERNKPCFELKESLKRKMISSAGKLKSIQRIVESERNHLKEELRLLILTDYIKKKALNLVGDTKELTHISLVSIFETLRKTVDVSLGCLSGSLVILPISVLSVFSSFKIPEDSYTFQPLKETDYATVTFKGNKQRKIQIISKLFEEGYIQVLIGTQALLGEGWDSPCINSLILASYVGSFMLSNQMRGRAIRSYRKNPDKTANIWHLATLEPPYIFEDDLIKQIHAKLHEDKDQITSFDYHTLCRRFDCFLGPNYDTLDIESGIERVSIIKPPYTKDHIEQMNIEMLSRSNQREAMAQSWKKVLDIGVYMTNESQVPKVCRIPAFTYFNFLSLFLAGAIECFLIQTIVSILNKTLQMELKIISIIIILVFILLLGLGMGKIIRFIMKHSSPKKSITGICKAVLATFKELGLIQGGASLRIEADELDLGIQVAIKNATIHEQNIFNQAIQELLSPINNPKYIIVKENAFKRLDFKYSFACPSLISKKEGATILSGYLSSIMEKMKVVYIYNQAGRKILYQAKKKSFISKNEAIITNKKRVSRFE